MKPRMFHHEHLVIEAFYNKECDECTGDESEYDGESESGPELVTKGDGENAEGCCESGQKHGLETTGTGFYEGSE